MQATVNGPMAEMPRYICHKQVWALKIEAVNGGELRFANRLFAPRQMEADWIARHAPKAGGYFVVYEDGYQSFSPGDVFERGYTPVSPRDPRPTPPQS